MYYLVMMKGQQAISSQGNTPAEAFKKIYPAMDISVAKDAKQADVCIELINGKKVSKNYYKIKKAKVETKKGVDFTNLFLYDVVGRDELEGMTFASCTTKAKAEKAMKMLEAEGFEDMLTIVQDKLGIDIVELNGKRIKL